MENLARFASSRFEKADELCYFGLGLSTAAEVVESRFRQTAARQQLLSAVKFPSAIAVRLRAMVLVSDKRLQQPISRLPCN